MANKVNSKQKGARFERLLASKFREYGYSDSRRTAQYCGNTGDASDVIGLPGLHIEAKHQERMSLYDWVNQAKRDADANGESRIPVVFHKKNNAEILVTLTLDGFMDIYKEFEAGRSVDMADSKEYIEKESLLQALEEENDFYGIDSEYEWGRESQYKYDVNTIKKHPAADVVEVVRCKDCKNHNRPRLGYCSMTLCYVQPDDYCSYGEREEGDDND